MIMERSVVSTDQAPGAIGPYSQAIQVGKLVFTAGQIGLNPATGSLVEGEIEEQTHRTLQNIRAILEAAGSGLHQVIKTTVFMADMGQFGAMNAVYADYFPENSPARSTVGSPALPKGALVEIDAIAVISQVLVKK